MSDLDFEVFRRKGDITAVYVRINSSGTITLSRRAFDALGMPEYVELLYTPDKRIFGIRPTDGKTPDAFVCTRTINSRRFVEFLGVTPPLKLSAEMSGNTIIVRLPTD